MHIYIAKNGTKTGPYSEEQVRGMLTGGIVSVDDSAWCEGAVDWQPLHSVLGLKRPPPIPTATSPTLAQPRQTTYGWNDPVVVTQTLKPTSANKPAGANSTYSNVEILYIAKQQEAVLWFIPISILAYLVGFAIGPEMVPVFVLALGVISLIFIYQLALALKEPAPWVYAILALIPCISLISMLILNGRATSALKAQGIRVGLMGARKEDLDKINANTA